MPQEITGKGIEQEAPVIQQTRQTKYSELCESKSKWKILLFIGYWFSVVLPLRDLCVYFSNQKVTKGAVEKPQVETPVVAGPQAQTPVVANREVGIEIPFQREVLRDKFMKLFDKIDFYCNSIINSGSPIFSSIISTKYDPKNPAAFKIIAHGEVSTDLYGQHYHLNIDAFADRRVSDAHEDAFPPLFQSDTSDAVLLIPPKNMESANITRLVQQHGRAGFSALVESILNTMNYLQDTQDVFKDGFYVSTNGLGATLEDGTDRKAQDLLNVRFEVEPKHYDPAATQGLFSKV